ncbi:hypothetical protein KY308_03475, partial [Candidatus Woesearchaeota archaeon]|nr:hypothetical protein [Candidatus Woesearchaeota archaeon]
AGLDEIRIHPDIYSPKLWHKIDLVKKYKWDIGVEIPAIPNAKKQTEKLIDFFKGKIEFLNINELEIADNQTQKLGTFVPKNRVSYGVKGSEHLAKYLLKKYQSQIKKIHYCTTELKNRAQMANRIKRRAKNVKKPYDYVTEEGMLVRGAIYGKNLVSVKNKLIKQHDIPKKLFEIDEKKKRLLTTAEVADRLKEELKQLNLKPAIVTEYPTWDQFPVEIEYL